MKTREEKNLEKKRERRWKGSRSECKKTESKLRKNAGNETEREKIKTNHETKRRVGVKTHRITPFPGHRKTRSSRLTEESARVGRSLRGLLVHAFVPRTSDELHKLGKTRSLAVRGGA